MLRDTGAKDIKFRTCYCCSAEGKVVCEFDAPNKESLSEALRKIDFPVESIMETTKLIPEKVMPSFRCKDIGMICEFEATAENVEELMKKIAEHAREAHNMKTIPPDVIARAGLHQKLKIEGVLSPEEISIKHPFHPDIDVLFWAKQYSGEPNIHKVS